MKIIVTGSLGNIGRPLTEQLVKNGHEVIVISSSEERRKEIQALGAEAAVGSMLNIPFLTETFKGADVVYLMEAVNRRNFFDKEWNIIKAYSEIAERYKQAIIASGVSKVIHLSSIGAHTTMGNGVLSMHYYAEQILNELPDTVSIKFMRPVGFFSNFYRSIAQIKSQHVILSNYGGNVKEPWVSPIDIASAIVEEIAAPFEGRSFRYIASDEVSPNEIAKTIGNAIGLLDLKWVAISDEEMFNNMIGIGMNPEIARGFVDMQAAQGNGSLYEHYLQHKPVLGSVKLEDFAKEFARIYHAE